MKIEEVKKEEVADTDDPQVSAVSVANGDTPAAASVLDLF